VQVAMMSPSARKPRKWACSSRNALSLVRSRSVAERTQPGSANEGRLNGMIADCLCWRPSFLRPPTKG